MNITAFIKNDAHYWAKECPRHEHYANVTLRVNHPQKFILYFTQNYPLDNFRWIFLHPPKDLSQIIADLNSRGTTARLKAVRNAAATKIQATFRGYAQRQHEATRNAAATKIQAAFRGYAQRKRQAEAVREAETLREADEFLDQMASFAQAELAEAAAEAKAAAEAAAAARAQTIVDAVAPERSVEAEQKGPSTRKLLVAAGITALVGGAALGRHILQNRGSGSGAVVPAANGSIINQPVMPYGFGGLQDIGNGTYSCLAPVTMETAAPVETCGVEAYGNETAMMQPLFPPTVYFTTIEPGTVALKLDPNDTICLVKDKGELTEFFANSSLAQEQLDALREKNAEVQSKSSNRGYWIAAGIAAGIGIGVGVGVAAVTLASTPVAAVAVPVAAVVAPVMNWIPAPDAMMDVVMDAAPAVVAAIGSTATWAIRTAIEEGTNFVLRGSYC